MPGQAPVYGGDQRPISLPTGFRTMGVRRQDRCKYILLNDNRMLMESLWLPAVLFQGGRHDHSRRFQS
jgi:hypothetical protein